jgi:Na+/H+-dicarboxylate symporter
MNARFFGNLVVLLGMAIGLLTGWLDQPILTQSASLVSDLFLRLLKLISLPIIFLSITSTITGMKDFQEMKILGRKTLFYTLGTTVTAAAIALVLFLSIDPANHAQSISTSEVSNLEKQGSYLSFVMNIIPSNFIQAFAENNVIGIAFMAMLLSIAILFLPSEQKTFLHQIFSGLFAAILKITRFIILLMPIAIWAFVTLLLKELQQNYEHFSSLFYYLLCVVAANLVQGLIVLPFFLKYKKLSPWRCFKGLTSALTVAFFSKSSNAALPITMQSIEKNLGVSKRISSFTLPLCSVINMNGCAAFILISVLFVSSLNGITFGTWDYIGWIFFATLAAVGNAGVPMGCFFLTSAFLIGMKVPLFMMGLILPFYTILDMIETALNVWSDACITLAVNKDIALAEVPVKDMAKEAI